MTRKSHIRTFCREEHLKGRSRIREVFGKGKRYFDTGAKLLVLPNNMPFNRICFTFANGRKFGNAVARNRAKRLWREAYRLLKGEYPRTYGTEQFAVGRDLILMIYPNEAAQTLSGTMENLKSLFKKAGLIK